MRQFLADVQTFAASSFGRITVSDVVDILIIAIVIYQILRITQKTRGSQVVKGLAVIFGALWLSSIFKLQTLSWLLGQIVQQGVIVIAVIFQPEIRRMLEHIGRRTAIDRRSGTPDAQGAVDGITEAMLALSKRKVGALIVLEQKTGIIDIAQTGTPMDSQISSGLLINIFEPNTPLHDGAVIINGIRIVSAGCVLPLTENKMLSQELGTRHRAGIGVTETTDAISLIVSEESGTISMAKGGRLTRYLDEDSLRRILDEIYTPTAYENPFLAWFHRKGDGAS